jgi:hypothetical protein
MTYTVGASPTAKFGGDASYNAETIATLEALVGARLKAMGFQQPATGATPDMTLDVAVTAVSSGSGAARFFVGFGAGRAVLEFYASFKNSAGREVASFTGGRSYTGMEMNTAPFASKSEIATSAVARSVDQIEEFIRNGGRFPEPKSKKR